MFIQIKDQYLNLDKVLTMSINKDDITFLLVDDTTIEYQIGRDITREDMNKFVEGIELGSYLNYCVLS